MAEEDRGKGTLADAFALRYPVPNGESLVLLHFPFFSTQSLSAPIRIFALAGRDGSWFESKITNTI